MKEQKYPLSWKKKDFSIKIFCSIPNIATGILLRAGESYSVIDPGDGILRDLNSEIGVKQILEISDIFIPSKVGKINSQELPKNQKTMIGDLAVTSFLVDHSAFDALAFLIEVDGKRLF